MTPPLLSAPSALRRRGARRIAALMITTVLASGAVLFGAVPAQAVPLDSVVVNGVSYTIDLTAPELGATAVGYDPAAPRTVTVESSVTIPAGGGTSYPVMTIGDSAFIDSSITAVTLPSSLTSIGDAAFAFNLLASIDIPDSVTHIGDSAFTYNRLTTLTIPNAVTTIGHSAFLMNSLTSLTLGSSLEIIGPAAFTWNVLDTVVIPASVRVIDGWAFGQNSELFRTRPDPDTFEPDQVLAQHSTLRSVVFTGAPADIINPTADTSTNPDDYMPTEVMPSLGAGYLLTVQYPLAFQSVDAGPGFTAGTWKGYASAPFVAVEFAMGGLGEQPALQRIAPGSAAAVPADPSAAGWTFTGWFTDASLGTAFDFATPITAATVIHAGWTENVTPPAPTATVSFALNGHGTAIPNQTVEIGSPATEPAAPSAAGWTFTGWFTDASLGTAFDFATPITAATVIHAGWTENATPPAPTATVSFALNGHGTAIPNQTVEIGSPATEPAAPSAAGWTFTGWFTDASLGTAFDFATPITAATVLYAGWTADAVVPPTEKPTRPVTQPPAAVPPPAQPAGATPLAKTGTIDPSGAVFAAFAALALGGGLLFLRRRKQQH